jgi:hypothetical protein
MDLIQLLDAVDRGAHPPGVTLFRFQRGRTIANLVLYASFGGALLVFGVLIRSHVNLEAGGVAYGAIAVFLAVVLLSFWRALSKLRDLLHADTNLIIVAPVGLVRRLRGSVKVFSFSEFPDLNSVRSNRRVESIYLNRDGRTFDQELVDDGSFGPMEELLGALRAVRGERTNR